MKTEATKTAKPKEKNVTFKVCATTIENEYNKAKKKFDKMSYSEKRELSIRRHIAENGFVSIPVEGKTRKDNNYTYEK